jgi:hypothetical protein
MIMQVIARKCFAIFVIYLILFLGSLAFSGYGLAAESWNQDKFRISDAPWVDNQQFALYLSGGGNLSGDDSRDEVQPELSLYADQVHATKNQNAINTNPKFNYQYQTLACELNLSLPFLTSFSTNEYINDNSAVYSSGTPSWEREVSDKTQLTAVPQIDLIYYYGSGFINANFSAYGDESFEQDRTEQRNFFQGRWMPETITSENIENYNFQANQIFRVGWGRIFEGNHTFQALQILEELSEEGQLQHPASAEDIRVLSEIIMRARKADILDSRLKTKVALKNILDFLEKQGLILTPNADAFLTVDDIYRNISQDSRSFGFTANGRLGAVLSVSNAEQSKFSQNGSWVDYQKTETLPQQAFAGAEFRYESPLSRQWQVGTAACLDYTFMRFGFSDMNDMPYSIMGTGSAYADYYFNTRWKIGATLQADLKWDTDIQQEIMEVNNQPLLMDYQREYGKIDISLNAQNQLTPDLYLTASVGGFIEDQKYKELWLSGEYHPLSSQPTLEQINLANQTEPQPFEINWYFTLSINYRLM